MYFSVIIPVFNRPQEIDELLESLTKSNFKEDFEILIIEDGSTDELTEETQDDWRACVWGERDNLKTSKGPEITLAIRHTHTHTQTHKHTHNLKTNKAQRPLWSW